MCLDEVRSVLCLPHRYRAFCMCLPTDRWPDRGRSLEQGIQDNQIRYDVNAGEKMHQRAGVKLHRDGTPKAPTGGLLLGDKQDEKPNCLTRECYRVVEP